MRLLADSWTGLVGRARAGLATAGLITVLPPGFRLGGSFPTWLRLGAVTPSIVSSLLARLCCRYGRDFFRKGTRQGCGLVLSSFCSLVVNTSGSTLTGRNRQDPVRGLLHHKRDDL